MGIHVIGVNYKTTPLQIREKFSIGAEELEKVLSGIKSLKGVTECAVLSTCNRTELHIFSEDTLFDTGYIEERLCSLKGLEIYQVKKYFYVYEGTGAIRHIIKVASGMDSMVLGEDQILGQFKKAYELSIKNGTSKSVLNTLSRLAITSSKKIKTRNITVGKVSSVAGQACGLLSELFGEGLTGKNVLIIGGGEIGGAVKEKLLEEGVREIYITSRRQGKVCSADNNKSKVETISYDDRYSYIEQCDIVIGATSSPHYTITRDMLEKIIADKAKEYIFIDLAVPRDFDDSIGQIRNVNIYNIDDLKRTISRDRNTRPMDLDFIQEQINSHSDEFLRWFQYRKTFLVKGGKIEDGSVSPFCRSER